MVLCVFMRLCRARFSLSLLDDARALRQWLPESILSAAALRANLGSMRPAATAKDVFRRVTYRRRASMMDFLGLEELSMLASVFTAASVNARGPGLVRHGVPTDDGQTMHMSTTT